MDRYAHYQQKYNAHKCNFTNAPAAFKIGTMKVNIHVMTFMKTENKHMSLGG